MKKYFDPLDCDWGRRGQLAFYGSLQYYGPGPGSYPVMDRIDRTFGPARIWWRPKPIQRPRPRVGIRRRARGILAELTGIPLIDIHFTLPGKLDLQAEWVLERILNAERGTRERQFLVALARDAGVYPPPKWWRVTRRLQKKPWFSTRSRSAK